MARRKSRFEERRHRDWYEFCKLEKDKHSIIDDTALASLIRSCADSDDISAIKLAFDRADGIQVTQIEIRVPKFYLRFPNAKEVEPDVPLLDAGEEKPEEDPIKKASSYDPASAKLRETLKERRGMSRQVIPDVFKHQKTMEQAINDRLEVPADVHKPMVKSVIVANLLKNVRKGKFKAIELVFDQIDGKLPKAIQLLGGKDIEVDDPTVTIAPPGSTLGDDGVYFIEDQKMTTLWLRGFAQSQKGLEMLAEGLEDND